MGAQNSSQVIRINESDSGTIEMSSDKNSVPKSVSKNSHSFDDRICDDLSEVLLQFLPLEGKQRLECVSKQFQRTVFQKQFKITLYSSFQSNHEMSEDMKEKLFDKTYMKSIESILKKYPNIQSMVLYLKNKIIFQSIVPLITKYCDHLNEFRVYLKDRSEPEMNEEFYRKFGPKLKYIRSAQSLDFNLFPNLHSLDKSNFGYSYVTAFPENVLPLNLKKLKELNITLIDENMHLFREVLQKFHKFRHLCLDLLNDLQKSVFNAFKESPVLQNLIEVKYKAKIRENGNQFLHSMKQLKKKFPKLKSIEIKSVLVIDFSDLRQQMSPLKSFSELKRTDFWLKFQPEKNHDKLSLKQFEELSNITHMSLRFDVKQLCKEILTDIDIYLPKLQYLSINRVIITNEEGVKQMAESLSRLSSLQTIVLRLKNRLISELMKAIVVEKCKKIKNGSIYYLFNFS